MKRKNILISLTHFCDIHGPRVISVTQCGDTSDDGNELLVPNYPIDSYCDSCLLTFPQNDIRSMRTRANDCTYVTTQYSSIRYQILNSITKKVFSEETMTYDSLPSVFHDSARGLNLCMGFKLYDENARGNERRYCLIFTIDTDQIHQSMKILSHNWNFIQLGFQKMINHIKNFRMEALNAIRQERNKDNNKNSEFVSFMGNYLRANKSKIDKNLIELTNDKSLFIRIHKWNAYLINSLILP